MTIQPMYESCLHILCSILRMFEPLELVKELVMWVPSRYELVVFFCNRSRMSCISDLLKEF